jgi:HTH-type transcriptional regulator, transcriptional repressor of NAD biosynthesis genes
VELVRTAAALCTRVTLLVMASSVESLSLAQRVTWMREIHARDPNVTVTGVIDDERIDYHDDAVWRAHIALMLQAAREVTHTPIDCVFTSEAYGVEMARRLDARHVAVDPARELG